MKVTDEGVVCRQSCRPAAHIRYASMYGTDLVELHKYREALSPLDEAIHVASETHGAVYSTIAISAKIEALRRARSKQRSGRRRGNAESLYAPS
jgi:hypothetical protein